MYSSLRRGRPRETGATTLAAESTAPLELAGGRAVGVDDAAVAFVAAAICSGLQELKKFQHLLSREKKMHVNRFPLASMRYVSDPHLLKYLSDSVQLVPLLVVVHTLVRSSIRRQPSVSGLMLMCEDDEVVVVVMKE